MRTTFTEIIFNFILISYSCCYSKAINQYIPWISILKQGIQFEILIWTFFGKSTRTG